MAENLKTKCDSPPPSPQWGEGISLRWIGGWRRILGAFVLLVALAFMGRMVYLNWEEVQRYRWQFDYPWLVLSILTSLGTTAFFIWQWHFTLQRLGAELPYRKAFRIWFIANLGRYLPGKVWQFAGWFYLCGQEGISKTQTLTSILLNQALQNLTGLILAWVVFLFSPQTGLSSKFWPLLGLVPLGAVAIHPRVMEWGLNRALALLGREPVSIPLRPVDLARFAFNFFIFWLAVGMAFYFFVRSLHPLSLSLWPEVAGAYAGAYVIGFLSLLTPGGLGVREGALAYLLSFYLPSHIALIAALLSRVWIVASEILGIALALEIGRR